MISSLHGETHNTALHLSTSHSGHQISRIIESTRMGPTILYGPDRSGYELKKSKSRPSSRQQSNHSDGSAVITLKSLDGLSSDPNETERRRSTHLAQKYIATSGLQSRGLPSSNHQKLEAQNKSHTCMNLKPKILWVPRFSQSSLKHAVR